MLTQWFEGLKIDYWIILGLAAQFLFSARFLVQWIASERMKKSVIPVPFWYFSLCGGILLFIYSIQRQDPVFMLGQGTGIIIYSRNLILIHRNKKLEKEGLECV